MRLLLILAFLLTGCRPAGPGRGVEEAPPAKVFYAGPQDARQGVYSALLIADANGSLELTTDPAQAEAFVFNDTLPDRPAVAGQMKAGAGAVLILGPDIGGEVLSEWLGFPVELEARREPVSLSGLKEVKDPLLSEIVWNSAPQVRERTNTVTPISSVQPLVVSYEDSGWVLWSGRGGKLFVFNAALSGESNPQIQEWAYFNYLIYHLADRAAGRAPLSFADYPGSPVPHAEERTAILAVMGLLLATTLGVFVIVRRYSLAHPEALEQVVADRRLFERREEETSWEEVGYHRPLSGFLVALSLGLLLFIPLIVYQNLVLPVYILPSAQALGIWGRVTQFFNLAWLFFDMGTSTAFIKYLSEYRVHDPKKGILYGQVFVWWQALSGAVQVALVVALASIAAPRSSYAIYAWSVIIHAFIQIPGFYQVFRHAFNGYQRQDYARLLDLALTVGVLVIVQPLFVGIMYTWGRANPTLGGAMGGLLGLGIAAYAAELVTFLIGMWLYRRIGYNTRLLFLAHFDWGIIRSSFRFGVFEMLGSVAWSVGQAAEIWITQSRLINYAEIWGNWVLAQNFIYAYQVIATLFDGAMPAISEAISHGRRALGQYYTAQSYKWGGMMSAFLASVLLAVGDRFILGASGPEFARAAVYVVPLIIWGAIQYMSWVGDAVQLGSNRPYLKMSFILMEQTIRIVLAVVLIERLQINGLIVAYFIGLLTKNIVVYFANDRLCYRQRFYFWQSLGAPLLAGAVHFALLRWITGLLWQGDQVTSVVIFFIGVLPSFPVYLFLYGLFGGWDTATLGELRRAAELTGFTRPLARLIYTFSRAGARLSPLHNRFPITVYGMAMEEAQALTLEKVKLT